jgi:hypothetical protein
MSEHEEDPTTQELRIERGAIERAQAEAAEKAASEEEKAQHERRAEKSAYLREKLEERAESERRG